MCVFAPYCRTGVVWWDRDAMRLCVCVRARVCECDVRLALIGMSVMKRRWRRLTTTFWGACVRTWVGGWLPFGVSPNEPAHCVWGALAALSILIHVKRGTSYGVLS